MNVLIYKFMAHVKECGGKNDRDALFRIEEHGRVTMPVPGSNSLKSTRRLYYPLYPFLVRFYLSIHVSVPRFISASRVQDISAVSRSIQVYSFISLPSTLIYTAVEQKPEVGDSMVGAKLASGRASWLRGYELCILVEKDH